MKHLLLIYHSQSGRNESLVEHIYRGANHVCEVTTSLLRCVDVELHHMQHADAVVFVGSENFGLPNAGLLDTLARQFYSAEQSLAGKPFAIVMSTGNGGDGALRHLRALLGAMGMRECLDSTIFHGVLYPDNKRQCEELGEALASAIAMGIY